MMKFHIFGALLVSIVFLLMSTEAKNFKRSIVNPIQARERINDHLIRKAVTSTFLQMDCQTVSCIETFIKKWYCEDNRVTTTTTTTTSTEFPLEYFGQTPAEISSETPAETSSTPQTTKESNEDLQTKLLNLQVTFKNEYNG